jgi:hypothetical protein
LNPFPRSTAARSIAVATTAAPFVAASEILVHRALGVPTAVSGDPFTMFGISWVATLLVVGALTVSIRRSDLHGRPLIIALASAVVGLNVVLTQVEAAVFLEISSGELTARGLAGMVRALVIVGVLTWAWWPKLMPSRSDTTNAPRFSATGWVGRVLGASIIYLFLYIAAGLSIYPFVRSFYETQNLNVGWSIFPLQIARGALYVAFALPLVRSLVGTRREVAIAVALLFPALAGVPDLLFPNVYMPDWVRPFHILEIGISNFLFGWLVAWIFWNPAAGGDHRRSTDGSRNPVVATA